MANAKMSAEMRLATYGTLAPGRVNNDELADLNGDWLRGTARGRLVEAGWGAELGYPGLILDPSGQVIDVHIFESSELPDHWPRLDEFEGVGYRRVVTQVRTIGGDLDASIYVIDVLTCPIAGLGLQPRPNRSCLSNCKHEPCERGCKPRPAWGLKNTYTEKLLSAPIWGISEIGYYE